MSIYQPVLPYSDDYGLTVPQISTLGLSSKAERYVLRVQDKYQAKTMAACIKIASDMTIGMAAVTSQGRIDQRIAELQAQNPNPIAQRNLDILSVAHANRMLRYICDDDEPRF